MASAIGSIVRLLVSAVLPATDYGLLVGVNPHESIGIKRKALEEGRAINERLAPT